MTRAELEEKWPFWQFEEMKSRGLAHVDETYEEYLQMRAEQVELARLQKLELFGHDGEVPYEEPPELDEEILATLDYGWASAPDERMRQPQEAAA